MEIFGEKKDFYNLCRILDIIRENFHLDKLFIF